MPKDELLTVLDFPNTPVPTGALEEEQGLPNELPPAEVVGELELENLLLKGPKPSFADLDLDDRNLLKIL